MASGFQNVLGWTAQAISDELHRISGRLCANVDHVAGQLRAQGAALPKEFDGWSCDQKLIFLSAIGPIMVQALLVGAVAGGLAQNAARVVAEGTQRGLDAVSRAAGDVGAAAQHAGGEVSKAYHNVVGGLDGLAYLFADSLGPKPCCPNCLCGGAR